MKIAIWHNLPSGGGKRALYEQVKGLVHRGHIVESWCPPTATQKFLPLGRLIIEHVQPLKEITGRHPLWGEYGRMRRRLAAMEEHCGRCAAEIESRGFDVVIAHPCAFFRTTPIALHVSLPSLLYLQEPHRRFYEAMPRLPWLAPDWLGRIGFTPSYWKRLLSEARKLYSQRLQIRDEMRWATGFDRILVNSLYSRESVMRAYGLESHVCLLGVDSQYFRPVGAGRGKYIIGLGNIDLNKGIERVVRALACVDQSVRPELIWVGNYADVEYVKQMQTLAASHGVRLTTRIMVKDEELIKLLSDALCMVYAPRLEPFGFAPLEANACGTTVIGLAEAGVRETIADGENGILVTSPKPETLGAAIEALVRDTQLADKMGKRARLHVERHWQWHQALDSLESHLMEVAHAKV